MNIQMIILVPRMIYSAWARPETHTTLGNHLSWIFAAKLTRMMAG